MTKRHSSYCLAVVVIAAVGCKSSKQREAELQDKVEKELAETAILVDTLVKEAQPRLEAFKEILGAVDSLPPPAGLAGVTVDKRVPFIQLDYARLVVAPTEQPKTELALWYGEAAGGYFGTWLTALKLVAKHASAPHDTGDSRVKEEFAALAALTHVIVVKPVELSPPKLDGALFQPGQLKAFAYVFDVRTRQPVGGFPFAARSSESVAFEYPKNASEDAKAEAAHAALLRDFHAKVETSLRAALEQAARR